MMEEREHREDGREWKSADGGYRDALRELAETQAAQPATNRFRAELKPSEVHESSFGGAIRVVSAVAVDESTNRPVAEAPVYYAHGVGFGREPTYVQAIAERGRSAFAFVPEQQRPNADERYVVYSHISPERAERLRTIADGVGRPE